MYRWWRLFLHLLPAYVVHICPSHNISPLLLGVSAPAARLYYYFTTSRHRTVANVLTRHCYKISRSYRTQTWVKTFELWHKTRPKISLENPSITSVVHTSKTKWTLIWLQQVDFFHVSCIVHSGLSKYLLQQDSLTKRYFVEDLMPPV